MGKTLYVRSMTGRVYRRAGLEFITDFTAHDDLTADQLAEILADPHLRTQTTTPGNFLEAAALKAEQEATAKADAEAEAAQKAAAEEAIQAEEAGKAPKRQRS